MTASLAGRTTSRRGYSRAPAVATRVLCVEPLLAEGVHAYLRGRPEIDVVGGPTDVLLVVGGSMDEALRGCVDAVLAEIDAASPGAAPRLVFVVDELAERYLWWAVGHGLQAVVPRSASSWDDVVAAVVRARAGGTELPSATVGWLLEQVRVLERRLSTVGMNVNGLTERETEILRMFAAGLELAEVARELRFSERTIKSNLQAVKERLGLRNRAHAVAYALRTGAI